MKTYVSWKTRMAERNAQIVALFRTGTRTFDQIGRLFDVSSARVRRIVIEAGALKPKVRDVEEWTDEDATFVLNHYRQPGWSATRIGKKLGRTKDEVIGKANRMGLSEPTKITLRRAA